MFNLFEKIKYSVFRRVRASWVNPRSWRPYAIIFALGLLLYGQTLFFDFTYFDDNALILEQAETLSSFKNIGSLFATDVFFSNTKFYYRPLLNLSFMIDAHFGATIPLVYHLSNILIHLSVAALLFYLLYLLSRRREISLFLALVFLVHPVLSQAVAWIPGRNDSLLALFILPSFIFFLNFLEKPKLSSYLLHLLFFLLSLFTKEAAIVLPVLCFFYQRFIFRGAILKSDRLLLGAGYISVAFIWFLSRAFAFSGGAPISYGPAIWGAITNWPALILGIGKFIFPFNLSVLPILSDSSLLFGILASLLIIVFWLLSQAWPYYVIFGWLWFLLFLLPSFLRFNETPDFLEHRLYLSLIGFLIFILEIDYLKNIDLSRKKIRVILLLILLLFSGITFWHHRHFSNRLIFWQSAVVTSPHSPLAQRNLGAMYYLDGDSQRAEQEYLAALALNENEAMANNNLALIYLERGNLWQAEQAFRRELEINPGYDKALFNLGDLYYRQGKFSEASAMWRETLKINPGYSQANEGLNNLSNRLK